VIPISAINEIERAGLGLKEIRLLRLIELHPGIEINPLRETSSYPPSTVSRLVKQLLSGGWVRIEHCDNDGRVSRCFLSETGNALSTIIRSKTRRQRRKNK
jgi:DNA-binding MarR family transcriptional regulator